MRVFDTKNKFFEEFDPETGVYFRSGIIDKEGKDTGVDPFMRLFPNLIDVGIMGKCVCAEKCNVGCYQNAIGRTGENMSLSDYESIMKQSRGKVFQVALGGAGDPDTHENFAEILRMTREYGIVPNFTTSGITFTPEKARLCKQYCGSAAVSWHGADYTEKALSMLVDAGVKANIHYVLSRKSIGAAIKMLKDGTFRNYKINAIVFLLHKPVGLGKQEDVLTPDDPELPEFFELVDKGRHGFKIGFDSCTCPGIVNYTKTIDMNSIDYCEGGRFSMYIDANMNAMPCSFGNQDKKWFVSLRERTIKEAWDSDIFERFRDSLRNSCSDCKDRDICAGGCPICRNIVLCNRTEKKQV